MAEKFNQDEGAAEKINAFLTRNRTSVLGVTMCAVIAVLAVVLAVVVMGKSTEKGIAQIDAIYYELTNNAGNLEGEALASRQNAALEKISAFTGKSGIVGVRANMIAAELYFQKKEWKQSKEAWLKVASAKKNAYTAPIGYYNAAVCAENLAELDEAAANYQKAADAKDFTLAEHALFNVGRVNEAKGDNAAAKTAYEALRAKDSSSDWAELATSRIIALETSGSAE